MLLLTCCWFGSSHHVARARAYRVRVLKGTEQRYVYGTTVRVRLAEMPWMDVAPPGGWRQAARQLRASLLSAMCMHGTVDDRCCSCCCLSCRLAFRPFVRALLGSSPSPIACLPAGPRDPIRRSHSYTRLLCCASASFGFVPPGCSL